MADSYMSRLQIDNGTIVPIGSNLFGLSTTPATTALKIVQPTDTTLGKFFDTLEKGVTIHVQFRYGNTVVTGIQNAIVNLKVGSTDAKPVTNPGGTYIWSENAIISFTYDGTNWVVNNSGAQVGDSVIRQTRLTYENLNDYKDDNPSWYFAAESNTVTNNPENAGTAFGMYVYRNSSGKYVQELYSATGKKWIRYYNGTQWSTWEQLYGTQHKPTASDVGLGNVENTALSTWTGTTNITTVGTLTTGTIPWARLINIPLFFPMSYTNIDLSSTSPTPGAYTFVESQNPVTHFLESGSGLTLLGSAADAFNYTTQLLITSTNESGAVPHAYIRRLSLENEWSAWTTLLDNNNYTNYTVSKNGTGATGTWAISITGSAERLTNAYELYTDLEQLRNPETPVEFDGSGSIRLAVTGILPITNGGTGANIVSAKYVFMGPTSGTSAPSFRLLTTDDLPELIENISIVDGTTNDVPKISVEKTTSSVATLYPLTLASTNTYGVTKLSAAADDNTLAATAKSVYDLAQAMSGMVAAADALIYMGTLDAGIPPTTRYTPAAECGHTYRISTAGLINGEAVEVGDLIICNTNETAAANQQNVANIRDKWNIIQVNIDGALFKSTNTFVDGHVLIADDINGKVKDSGTTLANASVAEAVRATQDDAGNVISTSYLHLSGGTMNGDIEFNIVGNSGIYRKLIWGDNNLGADIYFYTPHLQQGHLILNTIGNTLTNINSNIGIAYNDTIRMYLDPNAINFYPASPGTGDIGLITSPWNNIYATTVHADLEGNASTATLLEPVYNTTTIAQSFWEIPSGCRQVWGQSFSDSTLTYSNYDNPTVISDSGNIVMWLEPAATTNEAYLNMKINGTYYGNFEGDITGNADTANAWLYNRKVYVDLTLTSLTETINGAEANEEPAVIGIDGVLGIENGGTNAYTVEGIKTNIGLNHIYYGICTTSSISSVKEVICQEYEYPTVGDVIFVKFNETNLADPEILTLEVNNQGDFPIQYLNNDSTPANIPLAECLQEDQTYMFRFDGTNWVVDIQYDTNDNDTAGWIRHFQDTSTIKPTTTLYRYQILLPQGDGIHYIPVNTDNNDITSNKINITSSVFNIFEPIEYYKNEDTIDANDPVDGRYHFSMCSDVNLAYSFNTTSTLTPGKDVYIVATLVTSITASLKNPSATGNNANADATGAAAGPITQDLPNTNDGYIYIKLGHAYSTTNIILTQEHPIFFYKNGALRMYTPDAATAAAANITTTTNSITFYNDTYGTFDYLSSANGAIFATEADGLLHFDTLPVGQGGTGNTTFTVGEALIGNGTNALDTRAITNNTQATAVSATTNLITENTLYYHIGNSNISKVGTIDEGTWEATIIATDFGGTGNNAFVQNRLVYSESNTKLSSTNGQGGAIYASINSIAINSNVAPQNNGNFQVKGTSTLQTILPESNDYYHLGSTSLRWKDAFLTGTILIGNSASYTSATSADTGVCIKPGSISISDLNPSIDFHHNKGTTDYDPRITADAPGRLHILTKSLTIGDLIYNSRTINPMLYVEKTIYSAENIESAGYFANTVLNNTGGYYLYGSSAVTNGYVNQYGRLYIDTIGGLNTNGKAYLSLGNNIDVSNPNNASGYIQLYATDTHYAEYSVNSWVSDGTIEEFTMVGATSNTQTVDAYSTLILGNNQTNALANNAHSSGNLRLYSSGATYTDVRAQGAQVNNTIFYLPQYDGDMYAIHAASNNAVGDGSTLVYVQANGRVATSNTSVGDPYTPVYLNEGVFTATYPLQYSEWIISNTHTTCTLDAPNIFTTDTYVVAIVVTQGHQYLEGPITWTSYVDTLVLNTEPTTGEVRGYVLTARGCPTNATAVSSAPVTPSTPEEPTPSEPE